MLVDRFSRGPPGRASGSRSSSADRRDRTPSDLRGRLHDDPVLVELPDGRRTARRPSRRATWRSPSASAPGTPTPRCLRGMIERPRARYARADMAGDGLAGDVAQARAHVRRADSTRSRFGNRHKALRETLLLDERRWRRARSVWSAPTRRELARARGACRRSRRTRRARAALPRPRWQKHDAERSARCPPEELAAWHAAQGEYARLRERGGAELRPHRRHERARRR